MHPILKTVLVLIAAVLLGAGVIALVEGISHQFVAMPQSVDFNDPTQLKGYMDLVPMAGKISVIVGWALGMFAGSALAVRLLDRKKWPATFIVLFLLGATSVNFAVIPHPVWMMVAAIGVALIAWFAATRIFGSSSATTDLAV